MTTYSVRRIRMTSQPGCYGWCDTSHSVDSLEAGIAEMDRPMRRGEYEVQVYAYDGDGDGRRSKLVAKRRRDKRSGKTVERIVLGGSNG